MQANVDLEDKKIMDIICSTGDPSSEDLNQLKRYGVQKGFQFKNQELQTGVNEKDLRFKAYGLILPPSSVDRSKEGRVRPSRSSKVQAVMELFEKKDAEGSRV
jgi:hypothetical protein